jgi:hypothetical protein
MRLSNDAGNVGLYSGGAMGAGTAAGTITDIITQNATLIGISLTAISILIGLIFKLVGTYQEAKHNKIMQEQDAEFKRWQMSQNK